MSDETTTEQAEKTVRCRALKTAPMPTPRMRRSEFELPESEAKSYAARGWLVILNEPTEVVQVGALTIVAGEVTAISGVPVAVLAEEAEAAHAAEFATTGAVSFPGFVTDNSAAAKATPKKGRK